MTDDKFGPAKFYAVGKRFSEDADSRIGFEEWNLLDEDHMASMIKATLKAGFKLAEDEYECNAWFAAQYADGAEMPPGTIAVELPLGPTEDSGPQWTFSLYEMVERLITYNQEDDGKVDDDARKYFEETRNELRELADMIDAALRGEKFVEK